jgi:hypothetical protein
MWKLNFKCFVTAIPVYLFLIAAPILCGQQADQRSTGPNSEQINQFAKRMTGAIFVGRYTDGSGESKTDKYEIKQAKKLEGGDLWLFTARIVYGETDITVPIPLQVKWAGKTPVITLDEVTIPGMGTMSAHVVVDGDYYAGTWKHDDRGGHLFGQIEKQEK